MNVPARVATAAVSAILALALTGSAASAAFQPPAPVTAASEREKDGTRLMAMFTALLDRLVANGTITSAQRDEILTAIREAASSRDGERALKRILGGLFELAVEYLGLPAADVKAALAEGSSLGQLADATAGKSRGELIVFLTVELTERIDRALVEGVITAAQAERAKAALAQHVTAFVDRARERTEDRDAAKERKERAKEQAKELRERARERAKELREQAKERAKQLRERAKERSGR